jgi:hypothetical protein
MVTATSLSPPHEQETMFLLNSERDLPKWLLDYASFHRKELASPSETTRYMVYSCSGTCGGLGDRAHGAMSVFMLAVFTKRVFLLDSLRPFPLAAVFDPAIIGWNATITREIMLRAKRILVPDSSISSICTEPATTWDQANANVVVMTTNQWVGRRTKRNLVRRLSLDSSAFLAPLILSISRYKTFLPH